MRKEKYRRKSMEKEIPNKSNKLNMVARTEFTRIGHSQEPGEDMKKSVGKLQTSYMLQEKPNRDSDVVGKRTTNHRKKKYLDLKQIQIQIQMLTLNQLYIGR